MYFDSHAHYDDEKFNEDRKKLLEQLPSQGVDYIVNAAVDIKSCYTGLQLAHEYDFIFSSIGVHPHEVEKLTEADIVLMKQLAQDQKVVAVGEIGLDYYYEYASKEIQIKWFKRQLEMAKELALPVIIHSREATEETYNIIVESGNNKGVIHCFSGSAEYAKEYVKRGFYIGIGGSLTFKNAKKTVRVVEEIDLEYLVIETDCPYLTPVPHRGKRNDSSYLQFIVEKIAEIKGVSNEEVANITQKNAKKLFKID